MDMNKFKKAADLIEKMDSLMDLMNLPGNAVCNNNELAVIHDNSRYSAGAGDYDEISVVNRVKITSGIQDSLLRVVKDRYTEVMEEFEKL